MYSATESGTIYRTPRFLEARSRITVEEISRSGARREPDPGVVFSCQILNLPLHFLSVFIVTHGGKNCTGWKNLPEIFPLFNGKRESAPRIK